MAAFGTMPTQRLKLLLLLLLFGGVFASVSQISDLRKCGDKACSVTLSRATVLARYPANNPLHLSLSRGDVVEIKSKSAGARPDLWGGEVNGRRGYFPKAYVREFEVKIDNPVFEVPTEENIWSKQPHPSHHPHPQQHQKQQQEQQKQQQEQSVKQAPPSESASPAADNTIKDETEIDETDLTDEDDANTDQMPQETSPEDEPTPKEKSESADSPADEEKDKAKEEEQGGWFSARLKDRLLQDIEALQRSLKDDDVPMDPEARLKDRLLQDIEALQRSLKDDVPMDPEVFSDFLAKQFGSGSAGVGSTASSPDEEDQTDPGKDATAQDSETKAPEVDQTDLDEHDQPSPAADEDKDDKVDEKPTTETDLEGKEEKEENDSPYINGVTVLDGDEDEEEDEMPEEKEAETKDNGDIPVEGKVAETEDKIPKDKDDIPSEEKAPETENKVPEDKDDVKAKTDGKKTEDKEAGSTESRKDEDSGKVETTDPTDAVEKDHTDKEGQKTAAEKNEPSDSATGQKDSSEMSSQDNQAGSESKQSEQNAKQAIKDKGVEQEEKKAVEPTDQTDVKEKSQDTAQVDSIRGKSPDDSLPTKTPGDSTSASPAEGTGETAKTVREDVEKKKQPEQPVLQKQEKLKDSDRDLGKGKEKETPIVKTDTSDSLSATSVKDMVGEGAKQVPDKPDHEERKKPEIQPDKMVSEPSPPSASGHQPVDIDFVAGQTKDSGVVLDSNQPPAEQPLPTMTPALQDPPSLQEEQKMAETAAGAKQESSQPASETQLETTMIDGTRFYIVDGEIETSPAPAQATQEKDIKPTATIVLPDTSLLSDVPVPQAQQEVQNKTREAAPDSPTEQLVNSNIDDKLPQKVKVEEYQTSADILSRKVLSVNKQTPPKPDSAKEAPPVEPDTKQAPDQEKNTQGAATSSDSSAPKEAPTQPVQPSVAVDGPTSVTIEGEEPNAAADKGEEPEKAKEEPDVDKTAPTHSKPEKDTASASTAPPAEENWVTKLSSDAETEAEEENRKPELQQQQTQDVKEDSSKGVTGQPEAAETLGTVTPPPSGASAWDDVPPPPAEDKTTPEAQQGYDEPTVEGDPYQMDDFYGRKISDEELTKAEEEAAGYPSGANVGSLEAQSTAFIEKLPPSIQSLLEQEPLGLSPGMTVLVTVTAFIVFLSVTCFTCLCSSGSKKAGTKSPKEVVSELEEKLLIAVKEKENLEDLLKENQTENKRMKTETSDLQSKSGSMASDLQNVKLHNEVLKNQVSELQTEVSELQDKLSRKSDDVKTKDKKTKDIEKEVKKLQDAKQKLEQNLQKKEHEQQRLGDESENLKTTIQNLTDQVQQLDTSKQQLLLEAEDWKEKVDELKERIDQVEQENRQAQETVSFKDSEIEVMKDCYLQLKAFEKGGDSGEGEEEDYDTGDHSKNVQEKIQTMMDVSKVNATLRAVQEEKDNLENRLKIENDARRELEEQLQCVRREMESSMADKMKAERQSQEAQTKLNVLSSYFKDKELQLQRELGEHEALKKQNLSKLDNADENTRTLQKELELSKQQVDSLKRELTASERDFRAQIAANEKKAHENWLNARAAERELKETKHEAAVLRQKLTDTERRQMDLIRPLPTRGMPPPGMLNGPPPPGMERSPSRGSMPPGPVPPGPPPPVFREGEFALSPRERERLPPSHPARHMPPPGARSPPPRMMPDSRASPPRMHPSEARSPPPYDRRGPGPLPPPHPMDSRSPGARLPPPDMVPPPLRGPMPPPRMGLPPMGSPGPRMDSPRDPRQGPPYGRQPPPVGDGRRHQSQV